MHRNSEQVLNICRDNFGLLGFKFPNKNQKYRAVKYIIKLFTLLLKVMSMKTKAERQRAEVAFVIQFLPSLILEYNLQKLPVSGNRVAEIADLEGLHEVLLNLLQFDDILTTLLLILLRAVMTIVTSEDDILSVAVSTSVMPIMMTAYFGMPPLYRALNRRIPPSALTDTELLAIKGPKQILLSDYFLVRTLWQFIICDFAESLKSAVAGFTSDQGLHAYCSEKMRLDRAHTVLNMYFLGEFRDMRKILEEFLEKYGEDDVGVTVNSDCVIQLCSAMIQVGNIAEVKQLYLKAAPGSPIHQDTAQDILSDLNPMRRVTSGAFILQVEVAMSHLVQSDEIDMWRCRASESMAAIAKYGNALAGIQRQMSTVLWLLVITSIIDYILLVFERDMMSQGWMTADVVVISEVLRIARSHQTARMPAKAHINSLADAVAALLKGKAPQFLQRMEEAVACGRETTWQNRLYQVKLQARIMRAARLFGLWPRQRPSFAESDVCTYFRDQACEYELGLLGRDGVRP
ncbi:hypothetical protein HK101_007899 [Irineochytrium annulatum]|nr:hypothetical protein HK101_007899 [Irineochytrium annulatum]